MTFDVQKALWHDVPQLAKMVRNTITEIIIKPGVQEQMHLHVYSWQPYNRPRTWAVCASMWFPGYVLTCPGSHVCSISATQITSFGLIQNDNTECNKYKRVYTTESPSVPLPRIVISVLISYVSSPRLTWQSYSTRYTSGHGIHKLQHIPITQYSAKIHHRF